jgi:hypothetical protein
VAVGTTRTRVLTAVGPAAAELPFVFFVAAPAAPVVATAVGEADAALELRELVTETLASSGVDGRPA